MTTVFLSHPQDRLAHYYGARAVAALQALAEVRFNPEPRDLSLGELITAAADCELLVAYRQTAGPQRLFESLPRLAAFVRCAIDISTVDVAAASAQGVLVTQASAGFVAAVSEWVVAAMIDLARGISHCAESYHQGVTPVPSMGRQLRGSTLGVIGYGQISKYLCPLTSAMGMQVLVTAPEQIQTADGGQGPQQVPLPALLTQSHFVVCLAPSKPETRRLMDAGAFAAMQPGAFFVNASRGELVDESALLAALDSGRLAGCALDVGMASDQMPSPALARHARVIATPHIGGLTLPAIEHQALETVAQVAALLRGEIPAGAVNAGQATRLQGWRAKTRAAP
jgi:D-3-phosphoglycerate dehydrogenase